MNADRRAFFGHLRNGAMTLLMVSTLGETTIILSGCNAIQDIENWVPVGEQAVNSILTILTANGVPVSAAVTAIVQLIETGFNDLLAAAQAYLATNPPPVGTLAKIQAALAAISSAFTQFVQQLSGTAAKVLAIVTSLIGVVISTIGGFVNKLPASASLMAALNPGGSPVAAAPVERSRRKFKKDFNGVLDNGSKAGVNCPSSAYLYVSFFEHF